VGGRATVSFFRLKDTRGLQNARAFGQNPAAKFTRWRSAEAAIPAIWRRRGRARRRRDVSLRERLETWREARSKRSGWGVRWACPKARAEIEMLAQQLRAGRRARRSGRAKRVHRERARTNVQRRIKDAIGRIESTTPSSDVPRLDACAPERSAFSIPPKSPSSFIAFRPVEHAARHLGTVFHA